MSAQRRRRIRISAKELIRDIKTGQGVAVIMEKYGLSQSSMSKVLAALLERRLVSKADLRSLGRQPSSAVKTVSAGEFLACLKDTSDDYVLMREYGLNPEQLKEIYDTLIEKGLLSEYEYYARDTKAPELEQPAPPDAEDSTAVDLLQDLAGTPRDYVMTARSGSVVTSVASLSAQPSSTNVADCSIPGTSSCPNCSEPVGSVSEDTCAHCGIVFSKFEQVRRSGQ